MDINAYVEEIKLRLRGRVVDLEIDDSALIGCVNAAFRQIQRYIDTTRIITIPYKRCIDMKPYNVNAVARIFRAEGYLWGNQGEGEMSSYDPMYLASWQMMSGVGSGS